MLSEQYRNEEAIMPELPKNPFGRTGHISTRTLFGGAAFKPDSTPEDAAAVLETLFEYGVNHIDTARGYGQGNSERLIGGWMAEHRSRFFLATKTVQRTAVEAEQDFRTSLEMLQVDSVDLIQLHGLTGEEDWATAMGPDGVLSAMEKAREQGKVRFIGVTGHGLVAPEMHIRSLERFPFDSVLVPVNYVLLSMPEYRDSFERLRELCAKREVALQTIKSVARRPWMGRDHSHDPWYEPLSEQADIDKAIGYVASFEEVFINTVSDRRILPKVLDAVSRGVPRPSDAELDRLVADRDMAVIFEHNAMIH